MRLVSREELGKKLALGDEIPSPIRSLMRMARHVVEDTGTYFDTHTHTRTPHILPFVFPVRTFPEGGEREKGGLKLRPVPVCERFGETQTFQPTLCPRGFVCVCVCVCVCVSVRPEWARRGTNPHSALQECHLGGHLARTTK